MDYKGRVCYKWFAAALLFLCCLALGACAGADGRNPATQSTAQSAAQPSGQTQNDGQTTAQDPPPETPVKIRIVAAGDNLLHNSVSTFCQTASGYDFSKLYTNIKPVLKGADVAFLNQEVMFTGTAGKYPLLSAPYEAAQAVWDAGFTVLNMATNHSLDKGQGGLLRSLECAGKLPFDAILGAFPTEQAAKLPVILEKQGMKIGMLSYAYDTNGIPLPKDKPWLVSLIDEQKILSDIEKIRPMCDYLIVSMHWGVENRTTASAEQKRLAQVLCDHGVDLLIGHHPHVLEPCEWLYSQTGHGMFCTYSLGNFVSGQQLRNNMLGGIAEVELEFYPQSKKIVPVRAGVIPTVTQIEGKMKYYKIYLLSEYTDELAAEHAIKNYDKPASVKYFTDLAKGVLGDNMLSWEGAQ